MHRTPRQGRYLTCLRRPTPQPLPGAATLQPAASRALPSLPLNKLGSAALLALGLGLALAPATVLGGLLHPGAETTTAALLECVVYGYILLQVCFGEGGGRQDACKGLKGPAGAGSGQRPMVAPPPPPPPVHCYSLHCALARGRACWGTGRSCCLRS